jgi:L-fucose mutarotase
MMLKGVSPLLSPDLLWVLGAMGHGDDVVVVDRNFPGTAIAPETASGQLIRVQGAGEAELLQAILSVLPLDGFVEAPIVGMEVVGEPETELPIHREMLAIAEAAEGRSLTLERMERFAFYEAARSAFAIVQCAEARPYGCFMLKKGVIFG